MSSGWTRKARGYAARGWVHEKNREWDKALGDFNAAIRLRPKWPGYYNARARLWIARGDYDRGIADFQTAVRLNPHNPAATFEDWPRPSLPRPT